METCGSTVNAANPWLTTVSRGTKKRSLVQFLFTVLVPHGLLRLPAGRRVFFLLNIQFHFCFGFVSLLFQSLAGMWWWPVRGYRAGCAPASISILGLERIIQRGNAQRKESVVLQIARISPLKSLPLHLCSVFPRPVAAVAVLLFIWGVCGRCLCGRVWDIICREGSRGSWEHIPVHPPGWGIPHS